MNEETTFYALIYAIVVLFFLAMFSLCIIGSKERGQYYECVKTSQQPELCEIK